MKEFLHEFCYIALDVITVIIFILQGLIFVLTFVALYNEQYSALLFVLLLGYTFRFINYVIKKIKTRLENKKS